MSSPCLIPEVSPSSLIETRQSFLAGLNKLLHRSHGSPSNLGGVVHTTLADVQQLVQAEKYSEEQARELFSPLLSCMNYFEDASQEVRSIVDGVLKCLAPATLYNAAVLEGTAVSVLSPYARACIFERCLENLFKQTTSTTPISWDAILPMLHVDTSDLKYNDFITACQANRSFLALYANTLKRLPECRSFQDELRICADIMIWITLANVKVAPGTEKLLLFIPLLLTLQIRNLNSANIPEHQFSSTISQLSDWASKIMLDREKSGLLGFVGLGDKSVHSSRVRLVTRILHTSCVANTTETGFNRLIHVRSKLTPAAGLKIACQ